MSKLKGTKAIEALIHELQVSDTVQPHVTAQLKSTSKLLRHAIATKDAKQVEKRVDELARLILEALQEKK